MSEELPSKLPSSYAGRLVTANDPVQKYVYVVDDESSVRKSLSYTLKSAGFEVRPFCSGSDFLDSVDILAPGCVLLDLKMPELSGLEVLDILGGYLRKFPCVAITGYGDLRTAVDAMKLGAADFLEKPFKDETLLSALDSAFVALDEGVKSETTHVRAGKLVTSLSLRERETLQGLVNGMSNKVIAHKLGISVRTVEMHRKNLMERLGVRSLAEAIHIAIAAGLRPV